MDGSNFLCSRRQAYVVILSGTVCCLSLLLASSFISRKANGVERIVSEVQNLKEELLVLDVNCKGSSRRDIRLLRETARRLDSARAHASDKLSLYSSTVGLAGSAMVLAGLIPTPLSPVLLSYGNYLALSSVLGHLGNALIAEEYYDLDEVKDVLKNVNEFYEVMLHLENAYTVLLKVKPKALLKGKNGRTLNEQEQQHILLEIERLRNMKRTLEGREEITLSDTKEFIKNLVEFLDKLDRALDISADFSEDIQGVRETAVGLPKQAFAVSTFVKDVSYRSSTESILVHAAGSGSKALIMNAGTKTVLTGIMSFISIVAESKNIEEVSRKIRNREEFIRFLRDVANDMQRICNGSPYCLT